MRLKLLIALLVGAPIALLVAGAGIGFAAAPVFMTSYNDGEYGITHTLTSVSSTTATSIAARPGYRKVTLQFEPTLAQMNGTSCYIRLDGSSSSMSNGYAVIFTSQTTDTSRRIFSETFETNRAIYIQLPAATAGSVVLRHTQKYK